MSTERETSESKAVEQLHAEQADSLSACINMDTAESDSNENKSCQQGKALLLARRLTVASTVLSLPSLTSWAAERMSCNGRMEDPVVLQGVKGLVDEFTAVTGSPQTGMTLEQFTSLIESDNNFIARSIFERMSCNVAPTISCKDFVASMSLMRFGTEEDLLEFAFRIYDVDNSGSIEQGDLVEILRASLKETKVSMDDEQLARMASGMLRNLDEDRDGILSLEDFASIQKRYPNLELLGPFSPSKSNDDLDSTSVTLTVMTPPKNPTSLKPYSSCSTPRPIAGNRSANEMFSARPEEHLSTTPEVNCGCKGSGCFKYTARALTWARNNPQNAGCAFVYMLLIAGCFYLTAEATCSFLEMSCSLQNKNLHKMMTPTLFIAKGSAGVTKLAFATIILPICRNTVTVLRETWLRRIIPFDDAIEWHKAIAWVGFVSAAAHTLSHVNNYIRLSSPQTTTQFKALFGDNAAQPTLALLWSMHVSITGILMVAILVVAYAFASEWPRQSKWLKDTCVGRILNNFNNFAITHCLFVVFYVLFIFHACPRQYGYGDMLFWVAIPLIIYAVEKFIKCWWRRRLDFQILDAQVMPGNTIALQLSKPEGFKCLSGQYVFISVPQLGWMEWHPFTLTTAPDDNYLGLQIRAAGDWTGALHKLISNAVATQEEALQAQEDIEKGSGPIKQDLHGACCGQPGSAGFPAVLVDGPYGAPTQKWQKYGTVVMVGAGIGVTPCASVLRDVLHNMRREERDPNNHDRPALKMQSRRARGPECSTKKVVFYWCTRNKDEAQWFREELESIAKIDTQGMLDINIHITSVGDGDPMSNLLKLGQLSSHAVHGKDVMTGLQTNFITKFGRPNWEEVLTHIAEDNSATGKVGVFYCGPPALAAVLQKTCRYLNNEKKHSAVLDFFQERF